MSSYEISDAKKAAKEGKPIEFEGLLVYPLTMKDYGMFCACESVLTLRMSTLPVVYAVKPFAQAIFEMECVSLIKGQASGLWSMFLTLLMLSLKIDKENVMRQIQHCVDPKDHSLLKALVVTQYTETEERVVRLEPQKLGKIRELIADINGRSLPDESENAELVEAEQDMMQSDTIPLEYNLDDMLASVAANQHIRLSELDEWTIYEFELIRRAIERAERFRMAGAGEMGGMVKFKNGNPYPSLFFDKKKDSGILISADAFRRRIDGAVQTTDSLPIF